MNVTPFLVKLASSSSEERRRRRRHVRGAEPKSEWPGQRPRWQRSAPAAPLRRPRGGRSTIGAPRAGCYVNAAEGGPLAALSISRKRKRMKRSLPRSLHLREQPLCGVFVAVVSPFLFARSLSLFLHHAVLCETCQHFSTV